MNDLTHQARLLECATAAPGGAYRLTEAGEEWLRIEFPGGPQWEFRFEPGWEALLSHDREADQRNQAERSLLSRTFDWFANVSRVLAGSAQAGRGWA